MKGVGGGFSSVRRNDFVFMEAQRLFQADVSATSGVVCVKGRLMEACLAERSA